MGEPVIKTVTIGVTVNLDNYESLRIEVEGEITKLQDVDGIISYLDEMLTRFGRADPQTADRVDRYRQRVLSYPLADTPQKTVNGPADSGGDAGNIATTVIQDSAQNGSGVTAAKYEITTVGVCAQCGAEVSKSQAKLSQMLAGKVLCTICFDTYIKPKVKP